MSTIYWQSKLWGLLHDPVFKPLHFATGKGGNSCWRQLKVFEDWPEVWDPEFWDDSTPRRSSLTYRLKYADFITSASDRGAIGSLPEVVDYREDGLTTSHLLSGSPRPWKLGETAHQQLLDRSNRGRFLQGLEESLFDPIRAETDVRKTFWWCWRCLPEAAVQAIGDEALLLAPAETRLPDSSIWSHNSLTAAVAGALAGYDTSPEAFLKGKGLTDHPHLAIFSFSPIQELIKASRKLRDFWAGSWLLHYLSARVCWTLALKYGPDTLLYPSLFQQPLIDHWLLQRYPEFSEWVRQPEPRELLTAGFPNVIVLVLPKAKVRAAMQLAEETLRQEWLRLGRLGFGELERRGWTRDLEAEQAVWDGWLRAQWQSYWSAVPIGREDFGSKPEERFKRSITALELDRPDPWVEAQNEAFVPAHQSDRQRLFQQAELAFLKAAADYRQQRWGRAFGVNVGSWWPQVFDRLRQGLQGVKNARTWELPTVFSVRSSISGIGPALHPPDESGTDWMPEGKVGAFWRRRAGLFDGREMLNASEALKRVLPRVLGQELGLPEQDLGLAYPDLTAGAAGFVLSSRAALRRYRAATEAIAARLRRAGLSRELTALVDQGWGIPAIDRAAGDHESPLPSRLLDPGWLLDELDEEQLSEDTRRELEQGIRADLRQHFGDRNPAGWYVLAAGDGDGMGEWLRGTRMKAYRDYVAPDLRSRDQLKDLSEQSKPETRQALEQVKATYDAFLDLPKRMGPSTHSALSRALLDFSNRLVPYLTEGRYAGRLIYSGGDDVLAYQNLWDWDRWLWDLRQCFRGDPDPAADCEFRSVGDYWQPTGRNRERLRAHGIGDRPLFTLGEAATISFGIIIADSGIPMAIALERLWEAEAAAKEHQDALGRAKDAVQVRVLYANGNQLTATAKFGSFARWRALLDLLEPLGGETDPARLAPFFEQAALQWQQHPVPTPAALEAWVALLCLRREGAGADAVDPISLQEPLRQWLDSLWHGSSGAERDESIRSWLKLTAFLLRQRHLLGTTAEETP